MFRFINLSQCIGQNFTCGRYISVFISLSQISLESTFDLGGFTCLKVHPAIHIFQLILQLDHLLL